MKKNNKGFTLVELLAVIVILGLLMAIAIPSVTKYITQSRKKTLVSTMDSYVAAVTTAVNDNEYGAMSREDVMYYIPVNNEEEYSCVTLEKGGTNPFGNWKEAYVVVNYDSEKYSYDYYFTFYDDAGYGMALTKLEDIDVQGSMIKNPSPVNGENITTQLNDRASTVMVLVPGSCNIDNAVSGGNNNQNNQNQQSQDNTLANLIKKHNPLITNAPTLTTSSDNTSDVSGLYSSTDTNSGQPTYYFRGNVVNNYVSFANQTWRIIRINEDGTVRLMLNSGANNVKYKFSTSGGKIEDMYYSSSDTAKKVVDEWYDNNIYDKGFDSYVVTSSFCEEARVKDASYITSGNAVMTLYTSYTPTFKCKTDGNGKGILNSKVALITYDEVVFAGGYNNLSNSKYYIYNGGYYIWTMSPAGISYGIEQQWRIESSGKLNDMIHSSDLRLRPVINLKSSVLATGTGTSSDPYVVQTN